MVPQTGIWRNVNFNKLPNKGLLPSSPKNCVFHRENAVSNKWDKTESERLQSCGYRLHNCNTNDNFVRILVFITTRTDNL